MELITPRLILREFQDADFPALRALETCPQTHYYEKGIPSEDQTREYLRKVQDDAQKIPRTQIRLAVTLQSDGRLIGRVRLSLQFVEIREWEIGWALHPAEWGKGYASEAARRLADYAFKEQNAHRLVAFCHAGNAASVRVMEKLGMHRDGHLRETLWWHGSWSDEFVYAVLEREWEGKG
jgi:ribosomal-protein-alanine N-acetyltransferase